MKILTLLLLGTILSNVIIACNDEWLDEKPSKSLVIPNTLKDLQAILDNTDRFNLGHAIYGEASSDNYFVTQDAWLEAPILLQNCYIWTEELYGGTTINDDWSKPYTRILYANIVLQGIGNVESSEGITSESKAIRGSALFLRALDYYNLSQIFCKPYIEATASTDLGLPLRLDPDINKHYSRSSLKQVYDLILSDLDKAALLLPATVEYKTRPSKCAAYALLSRISLSMGKYEEALTYADKALEINDKLLNLNNINASVNYPLPRFNEEVIFHYELSLVRFLIQTRFNVDTALYASYDNRDLRKQLYFSEQAQDIKYRGSYSGSYQFFGGLAVDELYLTKAECQARLGNIEEASKTIKTLLDNRYENGTYTSPAINNPKEFLKYILLERRKELIFRGLRWIDLRRLNQESDHVVELTRTINGKAYRLDPNSSKYVLSIPPEEIVLNNLEQNKRN